MEVELRPELHPELLLTGPRPGALKDRQGMVCPRPDALKDRQGMACPQQGMTWPPPPLHPHMKKKSLKDPETQRCDIHQQLRTRLHSARMQEDSVTINGLQCYITTQLSLHVDENLQNHHEPSACISSGCSSAMAVRLLTDRSAKGRRGGGRYWIYGRLVYDWLFLFFAKAVVHSTDLDRLGIQTKKSKCQSGVRTLKWMATCMHLVSVN